MPLIFLCLNPWVIDGDSVRCDNIGEIRLLGIDAPDFTFSAPCQGHYGDHVCNDAADRAATRNLVRLKLRMRGQRWTVQGYGRDRYGRLLADVRILPPVGVDRGRQQKPIDVNCYQLSTRAARYIPAYDQNHIIARECGR